MSKSEQKNASDDKTEDATPLSKGSVLKIREAAEEFLMIKGPVSLVAPQKISAKPKPTPDPEPSDVATSEDVEAAETPPTVQAVAEETKAALAAAPAEAPTEADPEDDALSMDLIRGMVNDDAAEDLPPKQILANPRAMDDIPDSQVVLKEQDQWNDLRVPLVDEGGSEPDDASSDDFEPTFGTYVEDPELDPEDAYGSPGPAPTPIERIRAREAMGEMRAHRPGVPIARNNPIDAEPEPDQASLGEFAERSASDVSIPKLAFDPTPRPVHSEAREWDTPDDHKMSRSGKILWRMFVYGSLLAAPAFLVFSSPFPPVTAAKHYGSAAGCGFATFFELAGAQPAQPGYHLHLDPNRNGIACEAAAKRSAKAKVTFIRPDLH